MKTSPFVGTSQLQQLAVSRSLDAPGMKKRVAEATRPLAVNISLVQPVTETSTKQTSSTALDQSKTLEQANAASPKVGFGLSSQFLEL